MLPRLSRLATSRRCCYSTSTVFQNNYDKRKLLTVSILGPPNAGKSTLFNRLLDKEANKTYRLRVDRGGKSKRRRQSSRLTSRHGDGGGAAIVSAAPGTTRDRRECIGRIGGTYFRLMDTAGVDGERLDHLFRSTPRNEEGRLLQAMMRQTAQAALQADLVLLMFDARVGVTNDLLETARWLRRHRLLQHDDYGDDCDDNHDEDDEDDDDIRKSRQVKNVIVLANKLEGDHWNYDGSLVLDHLSEATRVGFGEAIPISAFHGEGVADIALAIEEATDAKFPPQEEQEDIDETFGLDKEEEKPLQLAILGRQNVGKSTLVNALLQEDRVITGSTPGLTRDSIAIEWMWEGERPVQLVDTAGIRKRAKRDNSNEIEDLAVQDAMRAMKVADVAVLVIDADARTLQRQELAIADAVLKEGRALVMVANKMDLIVEDYHDDEDENYTREEFTNDVREQLEARFPMLRKTPIVATSALTGEAVQEIMPVVFEARERWGRKISTGQLNRWLKEVLSQHAPPPVSGVPLKIKYIMQTKGRPPTFLLFCNADSIPEAYLRYLTRHFQDTFEMYGMEVRLAAKKSASANPFDKTSRRRSGSGLGGRQARKERMVKELKTSGSPRERRRRKRKNG